MYDVKVLLNVEVEEGELVDVFGVEKGEWKGNYGVK